MDRRCDRLNRFFIFGSYLGRTARVALVAVGVVGWLGVSCISGGLIFSGKNFGAVASYRDDVFIPRFKDGLISIDTASGDRNWTVAKAASAPAVAEDGTIVFVSENGLAAVEQSLGRELWHTELSGGYELDELPPPAIGPKDSVFVRLPGKLIAVNRTDGKIKWSKSLSGRLEPPPLVYEPQSGEPIVYAIAGNRLEAVNGVTGETRWGFQADSAINSSPALARTGQLYIVDEDEIYALDAVTGEPPGTAEELLASLDSSVRGIVIGPNGRLYVTLSDGRVSAIDPSTGEAEWTRKIGFTINLPPAVGSNGRVYVLYHESAIDNSWAPSAELAAFDGRTGETEWERHIASPPQVSAGSGVDLDYPPNLSNQGFLLVSARKWTNKDASQRLTAIEVGVETAGLPGIQWSQYGQNGRNSGRVAALETPSVKEALDLNADLFWRSGGDGNWRVQTETGHEGNDSLATYRLPKAGKAWVETILEGKGTLRFRWRLTSSDSGGELTVSVDGDRRAAISGNTDWEEVTLNLQSGTSQVRWTYTGDSAGKTGKAAWLDDFTWAISGDDRVAWRYHSGQPVSEALAMAQGKVYAVTEGGESVSDGGRLLALEAESGELAWKRRKEIQAQGESGELEFTSPPAVTPSGEIYVEGKTFEWRDYSQWIYRFDTGGGWQGVLQHRELDPATGYRLAPVSELPAIGPSDQLYFPQGAVGSDFKWLWRFSTEEGGPEAKSVSPRFSPLGIVYLCTRLTGKWFALDHRTGETLWTANAGGSSGKAAVGKKGRLYFPSGAALVALSGEGKRRWTTDISASAGAPVLDGRGSVYIVSRQGLCYALSADSGEERWRFDVSDSVSTTPLVGDDRTVYIGADSGEVYALNGADGALKWSYKTAGPIRGSPTLGLNGRLYVGSKDGTIYALKTSSSDLAASPWPKFRADRLLSGAGVPARTRITDAPDAKRVPEETEVSFTVRFSGNGPFQVTWEKDGEVIREVRVDRSRDSVTFTAVEADNGATLAVKVSNSEGSAASEEVTLHVDNRPPNDDFSDRVRVQGNVVNVSGRNRGATAEKSEPNHDGRPAEASVWWSWVVPYDGEVTVNTAGSDFNTVLAVYEGNALSELVPVASDDDSHSDTSRSAVSFSVNEDQVLQIAVDGVEKARGTIELNAEMATDASNSPGGTKWTFEIGGGNTISPAIDREGNIYVASDGQSPDDSKRNLYAISPDGTKRWTSEVAVGSNRSGAESITAPAIGDNGTIYLGDEATAKLYAIAPDGAQQWAFEMDRGPESAPAIGKDGTVYLGTWEGKLYAVNSDGSKKWTFEAASPILTSPAIGNRGTIYIGSRDDRLYAIRRDGTQKWVYQFVGDLTSSPVVGQDATIYIGTDKGLLAVSSIGEREWLFETEGLRMSSPGIGNDGTIYVGAETRFYAINPKGNEVWRFQTPQEILGDVQLSGAPAIGKDGTIYVGSQDGRLFSIHGDGRVKWVFQTGIPGTVHEPAIGEEGTIYVEGSFMDGSSLRKKLYAIAGDSGGLAEAPWPMAYHDREHTGRASARIAESHAVPELIPLEDQLIIHGNTMSLSVRAKDQQNGSFGVSFELERGPPNASIDNESNQLRWTPKRYHVGEVVEFEVSVRDSSEPSLSDSTDFSVEILPAQRSAGSVASKTTTLAGNPSPSFQDGAASAARFHLPNGGYVGPEGHTYVADTENHRIRRVSPDGQVTTLAGDGIAGYRNDADGSEARFDSPLGVFATDGEVIYVADTGNNVIRKIGSGPGRAVTTVAGTGKPGYKDGPASETRFDFPNDLVVEETGHIYITEFKNHTIRKIAPDGRVTTFAGDGVTGTQDGDGQGARFNRPAGIAIDRQGNLYVTEWDNHQIRKITPEGVVITLAGSGEPGFLDGQGQEARFNEPDGIAVGPRGNLFVSDHGNDAIRVVKPTGTVITLAGETKAGYKDGRKRSARFDGPGGLGVNDKGTVTVTDTENHVIRTIDWLYRPRVELRRAKDSMLKLWILGDTVNNDVIVERSHRLTDEWRAVKTLDDVEGSESIKVPDAKARHLFYRVRVPFRPHK